MEHQALDDTTGHYMHWVRFPTDSQMKDRSQILYRVQDKRGRGPFAPDLSKWWVKSRPDHENLLPWFLEFKGFHPVLKKKEVAFGVSCKTPTQLKRWFIRSEYEKLITLGFQSVKIDYSRILVSSDVQCVFARNKPLNQDVVPFRLYS